MTYPAMDDAARSAIRAGYAALEAKREAKRQKRREKEAEAQRDRLNILNEHADFLKALTVIDAGLEELSEYFLLQNNELIRKMRAAIPPSIVATRKREK